MEICICGLDHSKPIPDVFEAPPIVFSSGSKFGYCHACGARGPIDSSFFNNGALHEKDCKYIKSLSTREEKGNIMEDKKATPKELFLEKVNAVLEEFEGTTGVEVHNIELVRIDGRGVGSMSAKTEIIEWRLTLK